MNPLSQAPHWADRQLRLDPLVLPQSGHYETEDEQFSVSYTIRHNGVMLKRTLERSGLPVTLALGFHAFRGVAARAMEDQHGNVIVTLELLHDDASLCVPLLVADNLEDIAADWRGWSERLGMPMLLVEADGIARSLEQTFGQVKADVPQERRAGNPVRARRPRFLARRRTGSIGVRLVVAGAEIIARH